MTAKALQDYLYRESQMKRVFQDPTADEMRSYLRDECGCDSEFDMEEAIYWYANDYHGGQDTNLYSALSTSEYKPGAYERGPEDPTYYDALEEEFNGKRRE